MDPVDKKRIAEQIHDTLAKASFTSAYTKEAEFVADLGRALYEALGHSATVVVEGPGAMAGKGLEVTVFGGGGIWPDIVVHEPGRPEGRLAAIEVKLHRGRGRTAVNKIGAAIGQAMVYTSNYPAAFAVVGVVGGEVAAVEKGFLDRLARADVHLVLIALPSSPDPT